MKPRTLAVALIAGWLGALALPGSAEALAPPLLGQHTEEILRERLGRSAAQIAALRAEGVI